IEGSQRLVATVPADPITDVLVDEVGVLGASVAGGEPRFGDDLRMTDKAHDPLRDLPRARRDGHPGSVLCAVQVARRVVRRAVAVALLDDAQLLVNGGAGSDRIHDRLEDVDVDHLPLTRLVAMP